MELHTPLRDALIGLLRELADGPPGGEAYIINPGDPGLLQSLRRLSAADASARPGGRSSVAAHVHHLPRNGRGGTAGRPRL